MALSKLLFSLSNNLVFSFIGILGVGFIIGFHEFGHFIFCKIFNVKTNRFSIGFGPRLFSRQIGETEFTISAIPIGGYVEMAAESSKGINDPRLFLSKPFYQKFFVMAGGITFNMLFSYIALCFIFLTGLPNSRILYPINSTPKISAIAENSAAKEAGLQIGDTILSINNQILGSSAKKLFDVIEPLAGQKITLSIKHNNETKAVETTLGERIIFGKKFGDLGVMFETESKPALPFFSAITQGIRLTNIYLMNTIKAYKNILVKRETKGLGGPVMIVSEAVKGAAQGLKYLLLLLAVVSISLAVLNLIPLPILDGGRILIFGIEAAIKRQIPERTKEIVFIICWIGIFALIIYLSAKDIWQLIHPWIARILNK